MRTLHAGPLGPIASCGNSLCTSTLKSPSEFVNFTFMPTEAEPATWLQAPRGALVPAAGRRGGRARTRGGHALLGAPRRLHRHRRPGPCLLADADRRQPPFLLPRRVRRVALPTPQRSRRCGGRTASIAPVAPQTAAAAAAAADACAPQRLPRRRQPPERSSSKLFLLFFFFFDTNLVQHCGQPTPLWRAGVSRQARFRAAAASTCQNAA